MSAPPSLSLQELELEYSPSSCIGGNYAPHLQEYAALSATALSSHMAQRNLAYGGMAAERLDLFVPPASKATGTLMSVLPPLLVFIHGGYWQELSKESSLFAASGCIPAGVAFAAIDYSLAPQSSIHEMVLECRQALRWLHAHAAALGFDPARITVAGSSAGAHLAAMSCLRAWDGDADLAPDLPAGAVLVSGIYDLTPLVGTSINHAISLNLQSAASVSPQSMDLRGFPPSIVCWGEVETREFKRQGQAFVDALTQAGAPQPQCFEVPHRNHFNVILDLATANTRLGQATLQMLQNL